MAAASERDHHGARLLDRQVDLNRTRLYRDACGG
jgi:hypothetical protein